MSILEHCAELPPSQDVELLSADVREAIEAHLGVRERRFLDELIRAVSRRTDPLQFTKLYLSDADVSSLLRRIEEEGELAVEALRAGRVQAFEDLFKTSTRRIGPAAGLRELGDAYTELPPGQRDIALDVLLGALGAGEHAEVSAALGSLGKNFQGLDERRQRRAVDAMLELASHKEADAKSRELSLQMLGVLFSTLDATAQELVQARAQALRGTIQSRALRELLDETIPTVLGVERT